MLKIPKTFDPKDDPFDPLKSIDESNSIQSIFWELFLLGKHIREEIRVLFADLQNSLKSANFIDL